MKLASVLEVELWQRIREFGWLCFTAGLLIGVIVALSTVKCAYGEVSGIVGLSDNHTTINITVPTKGETLTASLDLPSKATLYGVQAEADWLRGRYLWSQPSGVAVEGIGGSFFGKADDKTVFLSRGNRAHEWSLTADLTTYVSDQWRTPIRPYVGYERRSAGWCFVDAKTEDGQIDLAWKDEITFMGIKISPQISQIYTDYRHRATSQSTDITVSCDYGHTRTALEGGRSDLNKIDGILRGFRWHGQVATQIRVSDQWWLGLAADYYQDQSNGDVNYTADKESATGSGSMGRREWRVTGEVKARW